MTSVSKFKVKPSIGTSIFGLRILRGYHTILTSVPRKISHMIASVTMKLKVQGCSAWMSLDLTIILLLICSLTILNKIELSKCSASISNNSLSISLIPYSVSFTVSRHIVSPLTLPVVEEEKRFMFSLLIILKRITYSKVV